MVLFAVGFVLFNLKKIKIFPFSGMDKAFIFLVFVLVLNYFHHPIKDVALQVVATLYLIGLYFIFSILLQNTPPDKLNKLLANTSNFTLWTLIIIGLIGLPLHYLFGINKFVLNYQNYPYFGDVFRVRGFSFSPNLYISLIVFFLVLTKFFGRLTKLQIVFLLLIGVLSLTKEAALLIPILMIFFFDEKISFSLNIKRFILIFSGLVYLFFSLFYVSIKGNQSLFENKLLISESPLFSFNNIEIYTTTYFGLLKSGLILFKENFIAGVGLSQFQVYLSDLI